jgi:hypothetical protein
MLRLVATNGTFGATSSVQTIVVAVRGASGPDEAERLLPQEAGILGI